MSQPAPCLGHLGITYKYTARFDEARRLYDTALAIMIAADGERSTDVAAVYHNLGGLEHERGHAASGEPFARKSVAIREALGSV